jgi:peroxiredoxin Q/BCP
MPAKPTQSQSKDPSQGPIPIGAVAPDFALQDQSGQAHQLSQYRGRWVVLYFYPKDATPGCTKEACDFRDACDALAARGAIVLGVSPDSVPSHARFAAKRRLEFPLLADPQAQVCAVYGVWRPKSLFGRQFFGVVRTTYLIDPQGRVAHRWDKVKILGHSTAVLAKLDELKG